MFLKMFYLGVFLTSQTILDVEAYADFEDSLQYPCHVNQSSGTGTRIMHGQPASPGQFPWQVAVYSSTDPNQPQHFCGGLLISTTAVLTAAHCVYDKSYFDIVMGTTQALNESSSGRIQVRTRTKVVYPTFVNHTVSLNNDIAVLILSRPVTLTSTIQPVLLPRRSDADVTFVGQLGTTSGWGKTGDVPGFATCDLLYTDVAIIDNDECLRAYGPQHVHDTVICISTSRGTRGPCHGDSGGPMVLSWNGETIAIGIVSYGAKQGCESGYPDAYTRISRYLDWISDNGGPEVRP